MRCSQNEIFCICRHVLLTRTAGSGYREASNNIIVSSALFSPCSFQFSTLISLGTKLLVGCVLLRPLTSINDWDKFYLAIQGRLSIKCDNLRKTISLAHSLYFNNWQWLIELQSTGEQRANHKSQIWNISVKTAHNCDLSVHLWSIRAHQIPKCFSLNRMELWTNRS